MKQANAKREKQISAYLKQVRAHRTFEQAGALFGVKKQAWSQWEKQGRGPETDLLITLAVKTNDPAQAEVHKAALHCLNLRYPELRLTILVKDSPVAIPSNGKHPDS